MANHATKFMSVNLNKSYGQQSHNHSSHSSSYGSNRTRPGSHGGAGGGMVVLSRPRSSQKAGPKLSVPPPLNLPSLRKEHERFDSLGSGGGPTGGGVSGTGSRPTSSGMGWTKPVTVAFPEKEVFPEQTPDAVGQGSHPVDGFSRGSSVYMRPSARSGVVGPSASAPAQTYPVIEKAAVLRGEDFPSLKATLSSTSGPAPKQKEILNQKQKAMESDNIINEQKDGSRLSSLVDMRSQFHHSHGGGGVNGPSENGNEAPSFSGSRAVDRGRKQEEYFPGPLPLVRLNPRSDWADDERDTSHGLTDRSRESRNHGFPKNETYWDRDFDMPRVGILPHKPVHNFDRRGQRDDEAGKVSSSEVTKLDPSVRTASRDERDGNSWRNSSFSKDGLGVQDSGNERNGIGTRSSSMNRELGKDNKYLPSPFRDNLHDDLGKREAGYGQGGKQPWNSAVESYGSQGTDRNARDRYVGNEQQNRYRVDSVQSLMPRPSFSGGGKGLPVNDPLLNFGKEKRPIAKNEKAFLEDPFMKDFDGRDLFSSSLVGVVKKKKDVVKQADFHDPVRESFEAELERVQRMQEQERQRIIEEQERALELARREEEERLMQAREQEKRQRRLEEEAREAAWRAEQERIENMRKAEEQRLAREEEKQRILLEEERRKQAAKQKLLELEERIARRQAEASKVGNNSAVVGDDKLSGIVKEKQSRATDVSDWDDSERMVERIITSASSDSSSVNRQLEMGSRPHFPRDVSSTFGDRGKPANSWRRDIYENGSSSTVYLQDQDNGYQSPRRDSSIGGKPFIRKDYYGNAGFMSSRTYYKGGISEPHLDEYAHVKGQRWNQSGDGDNFSRNTEMDSEFHDNFVERFGDGWAQGRPHGNPFSPYPERPYPSSEPDGPYAFGRSRYSVRQPRVLPPPSLASVHKTYRNDNERSGPSAFLETEVQYDHEARSESTMPTGYDSVHQVNHGQPEVVDALQENPEIGDPRVESNAAQRCASQSSLSVSSPPNSPTHLSHDDLDEAGDSPVLSSSGEGQIGPLPVSGNGSVVLPVRSGNENVITSSCAVSTGGDDDDEWTTENNEHFQEQEEYDEDEDYQEEDEVHEDNVDLNQEFDDMHLEEKELPHMMDNLVLGFDEGVQVRMPTEDFEKTSKNEDTAFVSQQVSIGTLEEHVPFDNACIDGKALQSVGDSTKVNLSSSSSVFHETENGHQDLAIQPNSSSIASESLEDVEASNSGLSAHHTIPTSVTASSHASSGQTVTSNVGAAPSQSELPIKLQFGLFSGPSLIPSPVPAIQIGSIQMPLHLHPQLGAPLSHMHPTQPPLFQFGQLRYTQGVVPLAPQSMSFVQPNIPSGFTFNHNHGGPMSVQAGQDSSDGFIKSDPRSHSVDNQSGNSRQLDLSQGSLANENAENMGGIKQGQIGGVLHDGNDNTRSALGFQSDGQGHPNLVAKNRNNSSNTRDLVGLSQTRDVSLPSVSKDMDFVESKVQFPVTGGRGKRYIFAVKNSGSRSSAPAPRVNRSDPTGFARKSRQNIQRTEFRVRESADKRQSSGLFSSDQSRVEKSNNSGRGAGVYARTGPRKSFSSKVVKQTDELEVLISASDKTQEIDSGSRAEKTDGKQSSTKSQSISHSGQSNLKRNLCSEEDVDAPLQSGIIRVFEQPGIEAPSDEDDFIEVRSKRQMLNDRREQREKEIKAKSRVAKMPRKPHSTSQSAKALANSGKASSRSEFVAPDGHGMTKVEVSSGFNASIVSQALAPIGTPPLKIDAQGDLRSQTSRSLQTSLPAVSSGGKSPRHGVIFETKTKVLDNVQTSLGSWDNAGISQQVMALTQTQLDEAMKPQQFDPRVSLADLSSAVSEPSLPASSMFTKEKPFSSAGSPINSLLAGEKIQFGAVTSPTVLPPSSHDAVSHGIGPPRASLSDMQISHNLAGSDNDCSLFFDKEKHSNESHGHLEDCEAEAEAEAAASAVAVAAISSDEVVGNGLGTCSVTVSDVKNFGPADINGIAAGVSDQQSVGQSRSEEPLSVSLPADLSVETPPISLWPPLPSPQNSSSQMLSHFPGGPPSHFPFYEMNPMMGSPVFAFGSHDESASTAQSQPQKSNASVSGPIGNWQQCHSGVDSFYGPPTGFAGPFITPPGGIPGVQGPPHMVVYNHFAPVGQFGQVGLSFMGTTYIPSGKQPDWKHNPTSSPMVTGEGDMNNMMMASSQRNPASMPTPVQHLAPGSPLLPMGSPLAMFDVSPFQSSHEMPVQARWPHVPTSALSSVPLSMPLQQQAAAAHTSQFSHGPSVDQTLNVNRFPSSRTSTPSDGDRKFSAAADVNVNQLPDELGLVDPSGSTAAKASSQGVVNKNSSLTSVADSVKGDSAAQNLNGSTGSSQSSSSAYKSQQSQQNNISTHQYDHSSGYTNYQRGGGVSHKSSSAGEWSQRRMGFQGRNQSLGGDKSFSSSKVKQIYVAKQNLGGHERQQGAAGL